MKDDWVRSKESNQLMQIEEYQTDKAIDHFSGKKEYENVHRQYNGKVWCTWVNQNNNIVTGVFDESDLNLAKEYKE